MAASVDLFGPAGAVAGGDPFGGAPSRARQIVEGAVAPNRQIVKGAGRREFFLVIRAKRARKKENPVAMMAIGVKVAAEIFPLRLQQVIEQGGGGRKFHGCHAGGWKLSTRSCGKS